MIVDASPEQPPVGVVLAGGLSRRMGQDKALLRFDGPTTLLERAVAALRESGLAEIAVMVGTPRRGRELQGAIPRLGEARVIVDEIPDHGPLGGLYSALRAYPGRSALLVACDMPTLEIRALRLLATDYDADIVVPRLQGRDHPLHARYGRACLPVAARLLREGRLTMRGLLEAPELRARILDDDTLARHGVSPAAFANLNTPADVAALTAADG